MWWVIWCVVAFSISLIYIDQLTADLPDSLKPNLNEQNNSEYVEQLEDGEFNLNGWKVIKSGKQYELRRESEESVSRSTGKMPVELILSCQNNRWAAAIQDSDLGQELLLRSGPLVSSEPRLESVLRPSEGTYVGILPDGFLESSNNLRSATLYLGNNRFARFDTSQLMATTTRLPPCATKIIKGERAKKH